MKIIDKLFSAKKQNPARTTWSRSATNPALRAYYKGGDGAAPGARPRRRVNPLYVALGFAVAVAVAGLVGRSRPAKAVAAPAPPAALAAQPAAGTAAVPAQPAAPRQDVTAFIQNYYGASEPMRLALSQYAQASQDFLLRANDQNAYQLASREGAAIDCVYYVVRTRVKQDTNVALNAVDRVRAMVLNTPERQAQYHAAEGHLHGRFYTGTPINQERNTCDFKLEDNAGAAKPDPQMEGE